MGKTLRLARALDRMRAGARLMQLFTRESPDGRAYYVVPGGYVAPEDAAKIIERPDVWPAEDGLFPGVPQTWRMGSP